MQFKTDFILRSVNIKPSHDFAFYFVWKWRLNNVQNHRLVFKTSTRHRKPSTGFLCDTMYSKYWPPLKHLQKRVKYNELAGGK